MTVADVHPDWYDYPIYISHTIVCNSEDCPCESEPIDVPRRTTPKEIAVAVAVHRADH